MRRAFLLSLRLHALWFAEAFGSRGRLLAPLGGRRLTLLLLLFPFYLLLQAMHWLGFLIDEVIFRAYRRVPVVNPLFISGIPRSGTTFVHRTLARDMGQFTTFRTWEAILAPSITQRRVVQALSRMDRWVGSPLHRLLDWLTRRLTGSFAHIHGVGLQAPEEDYLALLPAGGCFILVLAFPASNSLWQLGRFQEVPEEQRLILLNFYKSMLQKHLYLSGPGKRLLSKNAAFASWIPDLRRTFPDARYVLCLREPRAALASQLSSLRPGLRAFATLGAADTVSLDFQTIFAHAYRIIHQERESFLIDHLAVLDFRQLREEATPAMENALKQLAVPLTPALQASLHQAGEESDRHRSTHEHVPLSRKSGPAEFGALVLQLYEDILNHPHA